MPRLPRTPSAAVTSSMFWFIAPAMVPAYVSASPSWCTFVLALLAVFTRMSTMCGESLACRLNCATACAVTSAASARSS